jgi:Predicted integral membrane protein
MIRWLAALLAGLLLGALVHLVSMLALPRIASEDAYSRLERITPVNAVKALPLADPNNAPIPFMDPAFATAICRYDLSNGPIKLAVPVSQAYTSVSFYTDGDVAYYAINDRSAGRKVIELDLMTEAQHAALPEDEDITAADRLIVDSPTPIGLIVLKALAADTGLMAQAQTSLAAATCKVQTEPPQKPGATPRTGR